MIEDGVYRTFGIWQQEDRWGKSPLPTSRVVSFRRSSTRSDPQYCHRWTENDGNEAKVEECRRQFG